jgi:hypothetical protein
MKKVVLGTVLVLLLLAVLPGCGNGKEADTTAPVISAVSATGITISGTTITWTTDEAATSQVEYGQTTSYGSVTTLDTNLVTSHSVSLSGLSASTAYHYRVKSKDASQNEAVSGDFPFTTAAATTAAWSAMTSGTTNELDAIWGSSASDVFAVGDAGTILHYNGSAWSAMSSGTNENLFRIWGSSTFDVFIVGRNGTILHYNGSAWGTMTSGTTNDLGAIWGDSATDVFAVDYDSTILHYDGSTWSTMSSVTTNPLSDVWGSSATNVFAVGEAGTILHYG